jgi:hypothetical protein
MKTRPFLGCLNLCTAILIILSAFVGSTAAQSSDPDNPTPMTASEVKGRWPGGNKAFSHFYSFVAGPGEVIVMFNFVSDYLSVNVGGQLMDAYGKAFTELNAYEEQRAQTSYDFIYGMAQEAGVRLVGRFNLKRRQKLIIRAYSAFGSTPERGGSYKIRVEGGNPSFNGDAPPTGSGNSTTNLPANASNAGSLSCLPKSGKLRLVMDDGTIQEINLGRVREATVNP